MRAQELYYCDPATSTAILHNTIIHLSVDYTEETNYERNLSTVVNLGGASGDESTDPKIGIRGKVVGALKLSITPQQYAQILDSLENITASDEAFTSEVNISASKRRLNWEKELQTFSRGKPLPDALPLPSPTTNIDDSLPVYGKALITVTIISANHEH